MNARFRNRILPLLVLCCFLVELFAIPADRRPLRAADHREAPAVDEDPELDIADVYAFVNPNDPTRVVLALDVNGFAVPAVNATYSFSPDVLYQIKIDNTGDGREDLVIQARFAGNEPVPDSRCSGQRGGQFVTVRGPAAPTTTGTTNVELAASAPTVTGCSHTVLATNAQGVRVFAGLREDPFVVDVGHLNRILAGTQDVFREFTSPALGALRGRPVRGDNTSGIDSFRGFNASFLVVEVPISLVQGSVARTGTYLQNNTTIGMWGTTSRAGTVAGQFTQVERMGQQLFLTVFVSRSARDAANAAAPENDRATFGSIIPDALTTTDTDGTGNTIAGRATLLGAIGSITPPNGAPLLLPSTFGNTDRELLRNALLPDVLRLDLAKAANDLAIGGNGYQNGRRPGDDVTDILLRLVRQLADVRFPAGSGLPGSGPAGSRNTLDCTTLPQCPDRRVLAVLQGSDFLAPSQLLTDLSGSGNERQILADFPFFPAPHPLPGDPGTVVDVQSLFLAAAILPSSRSVAVGSTATAFASVINPSSVTAENIAISLNTPIPGTFSFQTTSPTTNAVTGTANTPVNIAPGALQTFVIAIRPSAAVDPVLLDFNFAGRNAAPATNISGVSTLQFSASTTPTADIVAMAATIGNNGIVQTSGSPASGAFAVAISNVGVTQTISASTDTGSTTLPLTLTICPTDAATGACTSAAASSVTSSVAGGATGTYAIFVNASGTVNFDPAVNRIFVRFRDPSGVVRGSTSVAVRTQ